MPLEFSQILRGAVGLVDTQKPGWKEMLASCRAHLACVALPGLPEQIWRHSGETDLAQLAAAAGDKTFLIGAAGIWPNNIETITDSLGYTKQTIERARQAAAVGAAGVLVPTPLGLRPLAGQAASALVYRYFRDTQAKSPLPLVIYQPRGVQPEYRLTPESILSLVRLGKVKGLIMEDGERYEMEECVRAARRSDFTLICSETLYPEALVWGAAGVAMEIHSPHLVPISEALRALAPQS